MALHPGLHDSAGKSGNTKIVVVAVDQSEIGEENFKYAVNVLRDECPEGCRVEYHVVHARPYEDEYSMDPLHHTKEKWEKVEAARKEKANQLLRKFKNLGREAGVVVKTVELKGDPRKEICDYCQHVKANLLVVGERGTGKLLHRLFVGTVAKYCLRHAHCPVLVSKSPRPTHGALYQRSRIEQESLLHAVVA